MNDAPPPEALPETLKNTPPADQVLALPPLAFVFLG